MNNEEILNYQAALKKVINRYETEVVSQKIAEMTKLFRIQIGFIIFLVIFGIIINLEPNLGSFVGTLGLGGLGVSANWERLQKTFEKVPDRSALKSSVSYLKAQLELADLDEKRLSDVEARIKRLYEKALAPDS